MVLWVLRTGGLAVSESGDCALQGVEHLAVVLAVRRVGS
jgi:hypothetical protein